MGNSFEVFGKKYGLLIGLAVGILVWILPTPAGMNIVQHKLLAMFSGMVVLWITIGINFAVSAIMVIVLLYFWVGNPTGALGKNGELIRQTGFALSGYSSAALWLLVTGFVIAIAMTRTGVAKRIALVMMKFMGRTPTGAIFALSIANLLIAPFTPSNTARQAAMLPIVEGFANAYNIKPGESNFGKCLYLAVTYMNNTTASAFLTGTIPNPIAMGMIVAATGASVYTTWGYWAMLALPVNIAILILSAFVLLKMFPPEVKAIPGGVDYINNELAQMGRMTLPEKKSILYFLIALLLWSTDAIHGFNSTMIAFFVSLLIFMPKIGVLEWKETEKSIPWELFVYFGGVITISDALMKTKSFEWVIKTGLAALGLSNMTMIPLMIILIGFTIFSHVIWSTTTAMAGVMIPIYIGIAQTMGFDIVKFVLPLAMCMGYAYFLPFNTMGNILTYGTGYYTIPDQIKSSIPIAFIAWGCYIVAMFTYWKILGF